LLKSKFGHKSLPQSVVEKTLRENSIKTYYFENWTSKEVCLSERNSKTGVEEASKEKSKS